MTLMVEKYMFGNVIDLHPGSRSVGVKVLMFFLNPGVPGNNVIMAVQTFFDRRQAGKIGIGDIRMTILTLDLFNAAVNIMAEGYRLLGLDFSRGQRIVKNQKGPAEKNTAEYYQ